MKICVINNIFYPYARGGADKIARLMVDGFLASGDEVFFIATEPRKNKLNQDKYKGYFLDSYFFNLNKISKIIRLFWHIWDMFDFITFYKIKKILKKEKPDLVVTHNLKGLGFLTPLAISNLKIKHLHVLHDIQLIHPSGLMMHGEELILDSFFCKTYFRFTSLLFQNVDYTVSPSKWLLDLHKTKKILSNSKSFVIPNPVQVSTLSENKQNNSKSSFVYVGEIEKHKGIEFLLNTVKELLDEGLSLDLSIIGSGSYSGEVDKFCQKNQSLKYLGKLDNNEVVKIISTSKALIMPSLCYENSPTVIYEAYQQKTPLITSRIGGITELVHYLGGILFNPGDKGDLKKKIKYLISNYEKVISSSNYSKNKLENYQSENYIKAIKDIVK